MARKRGSDWIPNRDDDFFSLQSNLVKKAEANKTAWGIPDSAINPLVARRAEYEPRYHKSQDKNTRTSVDVMAHRESRRLYEKEIRVFTKAYLMFNPLVSPTNKISMGLTVPDTEPSPRPQISGIPMVGLRPLGGSSIEATCIRDTDRDRPSIHPDADGVECRFIFSPVGEKPPKSWEDCPRTQVSKKARFIIKCGMKNVGQRFYGFFRWANLTNPDNSGPWSNAQGAVIA
ncbi:MAG: hypothetical protein WC980_03055 [Candidatus Brocadiia bacterium]